MPDIKSGSFECKGLDDLEKKLAGLADKLAGNIMLGGLRAGASQIKKEAQERCPASAEAHWLRVTLVKKKGAERVLIQPGDLKKKGIRMRKARPGVSKYPVAFEVYCSKRYWYWKFVEFGHVIALKRRTRSQRKNDTGHVGHVAARPFMRPAFDSKVEDATEAIRKYLEKRVGKELAKK